MRVADEQIDRLMLLTQRHASQLGELPYAELVDRGDPSTFDFTVTDFVCDDSWRDLDLSAVVPLGCAAVRLLVQLQDDLAGSLIRFRKNGIANTGNYAAARTQAANVAIEFTLDVFCDHNSVIEYRGEAGITFDVLNVLVVGWWI